MPSIPQDNLFGCRHCQQVLSRQARFCSNCGSSVQVPEQAHFSPEHLPKIPQFAQRGKGHEVPTEQREKLAELLVLLARERLLLYLQVASFIAINALGFWWAFKIYQVFAVRTDHAASLSCGLTPVLLVNSVALVMLAPMTGTRKEIARLKQGILFIRHQIDYQHIN
jgi:hypothetical protein